MWYTSSSGSIELRITKKEAASCSHSGDCEADVKTLMQVPRIKNQLDKLDKQQVIYDLRETGAWTNEEMQDHQVNLMRLLWIACCQIDEEQYIA